MALSKRSSDAEFIGNLFECIEETEDRTGSRIGSTKVIEVAMQGATESLDASGIPVGNVGDRPGLDLSLMTVRLTDQNGRRRGAIGNGGDVHAFIIITLNIYVKYNIVYYMPTYSTPNHT